MTVESPNSEAVCDSQQIFNFKVRVIHFLDGETLWAGYLWHCLRRVLLTSVFQTLYAKIVHDVDFVNVHFLLVFPQTFGNIFWDTVCKHYLQLCPCSSIFATLSVFQMIRNIIVTMYTEILCDIVRVSYCLRHFLRTLWGAEEKRVDQNALEELV